ncbi:tRNA threonylcarbamoyladenosine biosynthesis protein RimN, partial [Pseudomonas aeruginosa]|nr:tRNA threonylcarbamoyladenosine biosynthesis protein RimN [Pseudomonas aeruginosa]
KYTPAEGAATLGGPGGGPRNPSLIRDLVTGQVIRPA